MDDMKIIGFCCNWCSYGGADNAGTCRMQYPPNIRIIRVMCSGRIKPDVIFKAFHEGADGVFVGGCHIGDCHYNSGNYKWRRRARLIRFILDELGIDQRRFKYEWVSASEGSKFQILMKEFNEELKKLKKESLDTNSEIIET